MQHLRTLWKAVNMVSFARDLAVETRRYQWDVSAPSTFFLQAEYADIRIAYHDHAHIVATVQLQAGFGWQLAIDQDQAGVYVVARRKPVIGSLGRCKFDIQLPHSLHISLKLERCQLCLDDLDTTIEFPPSALAQGEPCNPPVLPLE